ncbi:MAG TPA: Rossmann-like and DUF2520 domain-containing protein [Candidatus Acidoferrales bacterium]|nr:Rossmann-like and DUF2520 domain-containing protein [Candidatus Acidoferrales bacterium]
MHEHDILSRDMSDTIAIVGAGRVGRILGRRLRQLNWTIGTVVTRSRATARSSVRAIGGGQAQPSINRHVLDADVVIIATPDDRIREAAKRLAQVGGEEWRGRTVLHTSGALDSSVLSPLARCGAATGSMHPMQTFVVRSAPPLERIVFTIEGDRRAQRVARRIARTLGGFAVSIRGRAKPTYHAAGTLAAGHGLALIEAAVRLLMRAGFSRRRAKLALLPLIRQMIANFERFGAREAWTGPISRSDFSTVARHRKALAGWPPEYLRAYAALARLSALVLDTHPKRTLKQLDRVLPRH